MMGKKALEAAQVWHHPNFGPRSLARLRNAVTDCSCTEPPSLRVVYVDTT